MDDLVTNNSGSGGWRKSLRASCIMSYAYLILGKVSNGISTKLGTCQLCMTRTRGLQHQGCRIMGVPNNKA